MDRCEREETFDKLRLHEYATMTIIHSLTVSQYAFIEY